MTKFSNYVMIVLMSLSLAGCAQLATAPDQELVLKQKSYDDLPKWSDHDHHKVVEAFLLSCERIVKQPADKPFNNRNMMNLGTYGQWQAPCREAMQADTQQLISENALQARLFFERWFTPYAAYGGMFREGLFTGYFEASLNGAREPDARYWYPLHKRPDDIIDVNLGDFRDDLKGRRIAGKVVGNRFVPYADRAAIEDGVLEGKDLELLYVDDPVDAFFLHIQGSGRVELETGEVIRVGYAGQNGHAYYAVGRELVQKGELEREQVSLQTIRRWMKSYPERAKALRALNKSYIFFREFEGDRPIGAEGVGLTPERSLAIDDKFLPYGMPVWLDAEHPLYEKEKFQTLMMAQDTGGAIKGAVRGDYFWGHGSDAELLAGQMKSPGEMWILLPKSLGHTYLTTSVTYNNKKKSSQNGASAVPAVMSQSVQMQR